MDKFQEALLVTLSAMSDESLRALINATLAEQRRRSGIALAKCQSRTTEGLPNVIFKQLEK